GAEGRAGARGAVVGMRAARGGASKRSVHPSGSGALGPAGYRPVAEDALPVPLPGYAPRLATETLVRAASAHGVRTAVLRPGIVYGRAGGILAAYLRAARARGAAPYVGVGTNRWPTVHLDDLAALYVRALAPP